MQAQINIEFNQLVQLAKGLSEKQWETLKKEVEHKHEKKTDTARKQFKELLLQGPVFSKRQLETIAETREAINKWRTI